MHCCVKSRFLLCKTIVEWHHGTLLFASTEGQGSTFTVELPVAEDQLGR